MSCAWSQCDLFGIDMRTDEKLRLRNILDVNLSIERIYEIINLRRRTSSRGDNSCAILKRLWRNIGRIVV